VGSGGRAPRAHAANAGLFIGLPAAGLCRYPDQRTKRLLCEQTVPSSRLPAPVRAADSAAVSHGVSGQPRREAVHGASVCSFVCLFVCLFRVRSVGRSGRRRCRRAPPISSAQGASMRQCDTWFTNARRRHATTDKMVRGFQACPEPPPPPPPPEYPGVPWSTLEYPGVPWGTLEYPGVSLSTPSRTSSIEYALSDTP
jgi:hypothetical protein